MSFIKDLMQGFSNTVIRELQDSIHEEINKQIDDAIEKSMKKMFIIGTAVSLIAIGSFLFLWGVASGIDKIFNMEGLGFVIFGIFGILIGMIVRYNWFENHRQQKK